MGTHPNIYSRVFLPGVLAISVAQCVQADLHPYLTTAMWGATDQYKQASRVNIDVFGKAVRQIFDLPNAIEPGFGFNHWLGAGAVVDDLGYVVIGWDDSPDYPANELFRAGRNVGSIHGGDLRHSPLGGNAAQFAAPSGVGAGLTDSLNIGNQSDQTESTGHNPPHYPHMPAPGAALMGMIGFAMIGRRRAAA